MRVVCRSVGEGQIEYCSVRQQQTQQTQLTTRATHRNGKHVCRINAAHDTLYVTHALLSV